MKTNQFLFAALTAAFLSVASFSASQVTIGGGDAPKAGVVLDLNSTTKGGLLLSNVELTALDVIPTTFPNASAISQTEKQALAGMVVYNTFDYLEPNGDGLYVWDGNKWNYIGGSDGMLAYTTISAPTCSSAVPSVSFFAYNLGADVARLHADYPGMSPAKQQIAYLATCAYDATDATVWGDLYQWGRIADGHEKRNSPTYQGPLYLASDVDGNGQPIAGKGKSEFIMAIDNTPNDWYELQNNNLWGNGRLVDYNFSSADGGAVPDGSGGYYQKPVKTVNDPCPSGWRVPTQDEWERLGNYGCGDPQNVTGRVPEGSTNMPATGQATTTRGSGNELTWVPVKGGKVSNGWANSAGNLGGYAVYKTDVWNAATTVSSGYFYNVTWSSTDKRLYDAAAPEPLLFLPTAGGRYHSDGTFEYVGEGGRYWSGSISDYSVRVMHIDLYNVNPSNYLYRGSGMSVRCVKE
ncbi:MAG: fibrobacter succinogenes major paralogous domain-containing protein [Prevotellaceae bacterium]|jgi:uncharacterized protein (TIGR02145 family)|nr:fibrobacter succinogenes major paralogous domain-containing protein [Prevotellaceae bacterium]